MTVEPIPMLGRLHRRWRPRDHLLSMAAGRSPGKITFYEMIPSVMSTLDAETAQRYVAAGSAKIWRTYEIKVITLDGLLAKYRDEKIGLLSIDAEGLDAQIVASLNLDSVRPALMCIEANLDEDRSRILAHLEQYDYGMVAEFGCNLLLEDRRRGSL